MDDFKKPTRRAQQRAIDGILFGGEQPTQPLNGTLRSRLRSAPPATGQPVQSPQKAPARPQLSRPEAAPYQPQVLPSNIDETIDESLLDSIQPDDDEVPVTSKKGQRKGKGRKSKTGKKPRFPFLRHPIKTFKGWGWRKRLLCIVIMLVIIAGLIAGGLFLKGYLNARKVFQGGGDAAALQENVDPDKLKGEGSGRINILLLGNGGIGHEAPDLTDTILVASIDPVNKKTALLSIPRDTWIKTENGSMKLNAAYETGKYEYLGKQDSSNNNTDAVKAGFKTADAAVEDIIGIPIHYHVLVNFTAFKQAIDAVGGITVDVPTTLYDPAFTRENGGSPIIARAGTQQFNGTKALMYVRSRETSSDFARAQRQRAVIVALQQKILTAGTLSNPNKISQLMDAFGHNVVTDMSLNNVNRLYSITKNIPSDKTESVGLTDTGVDLLTTGSIGGQSVVLPKAGLYQYDAIRNFVRNKLKDGYLAKENAKVLVLNGTSEPGKATSAAEVLKSYGYNVVGAADAPRHDYTKTIIVDRTKGKKPYTAHYLQDRFKVSKLTTSLPDSTIQTQNADFVIILGE
jgi:polyisoprenyl-teichoic acid--peptidoglycan teichoic acid transferase